MINCRLCNSNNSTVAFTINNSCPNISYLLKEKTSLNGINLNIYQCEDCGFIQLSEENKEHVDYEDYFMAASLSTQMQECQGKQVKRLKSFKQEAKVLEIGCGDGSFLKHLISAGFDSYGIEPSKRFYDFALKVTDRIKNEYLSEKHEESPFDIIVAREVLEHVYLFNSFLQNCYFLLKDDGLIMIQVPRVETAINDIRLHTFFTDHVNYFSEETLIGVLLKNGFTVLQIQSDMDGEYTTAIARKTKNYPIRKLFDPWKDKVDKTKNYILSNLKNNKTIVLWGAGGKGLSILSAMHLSSDISEKLSVVDCDPMKIGRYTPVTNFYIHNSDILKELNPDIIIILADAYKKEIRNKIIAMNISSIIVSPGDNCI